LWSQAEDYVLSDEKWHLTNYSNNIQTKIKAQGGSCNSLKISNKFCNTPVNSRSENTPRNRPRDTSIRSIIKRVPDSYLPEPPNNIYEPPDVVIYTLSLPPDAVDVVHIVEAGIPFEPTLGRRKAVEDFKREPKPSSALLKANHDSIKPGKGMALRTKSGTDMCDGTFDSFCGREQASDCLLSQHNDRRVSTSPKVRFPPSLVLL
jgi:hypothetical protein